MTTPTHLGIHSPPSQQPAKGWLSHPGSTDEMQHMITRHSRLAAAQDAKLKEWNLNIN